MLDIAIPLWPGDVLVEVPEEHRVFVVKEDKVWTRSDLAVVDWHVCDRLDIILSREAFERIQARRRPDFIGS